MKLPITAFPLLVLLLLSGCAERGPWTLAFPGALPRAVPSGEWIRSYPEVVAHLGAVFERDLGFTPFTATIQFLPDRRAFEAALLASGYDLSLAQQTSERNRYNSPLWFNERRD